MELMKLLRMKRVCLKNTFTRADPDRRFRWLLILALAVFFIFAEYQFFHRIVAYLDGLPLQIGDELIVQLLNVISLTLFMMVLFSGLISSLSVFYMSSDLELLFSQPLDVRSIISMRLVQSIVHSSWMVFIFSLPVYIAYGNHFQVSFWFYGYLILNFFPFVIIPAVLGVFLIMGLMRYFPAKKAHQVLSFIGLIFFAFLVVFLRFLQPEKFFGKDVPEESIMHFVESLKVPDHGFLPSSWITHGIISWVNGSTGEAWVNTLYLFASEIALLLVLRPVSRNIYFAGWCMVQEARHSPVRKNGSRHGGKSLLDWLPMSPVGRALFLKDLKLFFRDPAQWSQLFILFALVLVYIFNIKNLPLQNVVLKNVISVLNIGLVGFVLSALVSRFVYSATSMEGKKIWTIYTSPVKMENFLLGKFFTYFPPLLLVAEFLVIVSNRILEVDSFVMNTSIAGTFLITTGLVGLGVGMGAIYPMFKHENVSEIATGTGGIMFMIISLTYVGLVVVLGARPMYVHFNQQFLLKAVGGIDVPICYGLIIFLTLVATFLPLRLGTQTLKRMDI